MGALLAEWNPARRLITRWPWRPDIWPDAGIAAQQTLVEGLQRLRPYLRRSRITAELQIPPTLYSSAQLPRWIELQPRDYADIWVRDSLPLYVRRGGRLLALQAQFNGWGGLDNQFQRDLTARELERARWSLYGGTTDVLSWVIEGGSIHTNGLGLILYSQPVWLDEKRNPGLRVAQAEHILKTRFGARQVIGIAEALYSDETGGHMDNLLTFLNPQTLLVARADESSHPDYTSTQRLFGSLQRKLGTSFTLIPMPLPNLHLSSDEAARIQTGKSWPRETGMPLCASYCNGLRFADVYALPQFGDSADREAFARIQHWNQRQPVHRRLTITGLPARGLLPGGGGWHCASHFIPRS